MKLPATSVNRAFHLARVFVSEVPASFRKVGQRYKEKSSQVAHPSFFSESSLEKKSFLSICYGHYIPAYFLCCMVNPRDTSHLTHVDECKLES